MQKLPHHQSQHQQSSNKPREAIPDNLSRCFLWSDDGQLYLQAPVVFVNVESYGTTSLEYSWGHHSKHRVSVGGCFLHFSGVALLPEDVWNQSLPQAYLKSPPHRSVECRSKTLKGKKRTSCSFFLRLVP